MFQDPLRIIKSKITAIFNPVYSLHFKHKFHRKQAFWEPWKINHYCDEIVLLTTSPILFFLFLTHFQLLVDA